MPQLDPSSFASQLFWLTLSFILLYVLLSRMLLPRVQGVINLRSETLREDKEQAVRMKEDAVQAREHYDRALVQARLRSQAMFSEAQAEISAKANKSQADQDAMMAERLAASKASIDKAKAQAKSKLAAAAADVAATISEKLVFQKTDASKAMALVETLLKQRG